jgi:hypothetical protein
VNGQTGWSAVERVKEGILLSLGVIQWNLIVTCRPAALTHCVANNGIHKMPISITLIPVGESSNPCLFYLQRKKRIVLSRRLHHGTGCSTDI